jgi:hypothetical protein
MEALLEERRPTAPPSCSAKWGTQEPKNGGAAGQGDCYFTAKTR